MKPFMIVNPTSGAPVWFDSEEEAVREAADYLNVQKALQELPVSLQGPAQPAVQAVVVFRLEVAKVVELREVNLGSWSVLHCPVDLKIGDTVWLERKVGYQRWLEKRIVLLSEDSVQQVRDLPESKR